MSALCSKTSCVLTALRRWGQCKISSWICVSVCVFLLGFLDFLGGEGVEKKEGLGFVVVRFFCLFLLRKSNVILKYQWRSLFLKGPVKIPGLMSSNSNKKPWGLTVPVWLSRRDLKESNESAYLKIMKTTSDETSEYQDWKGCRSLQADVKKHIKKCQEKYNKHWLQRLGC